MAPLAPGYQRFETAPIDVAVGESNDWAQWVGGPLDQDYDIIDITGTQSVGGHHALMYASVEQQAPGFTRLWQDSDQLSTRLMGGVGGEGGANVKFPPGIVFRVKKGSYLVVQTHYLNATDHPITARSVLDLKLSPVDTSRRVASIFSSTTLGIDVPPGVAHVVDVNCQVEQDLTFIQISNHMHEYGKAVRTQYTDPAGVTHMLKDDPSWSYEYALNPNFAKFSPDAPTIVPAGSLLHTRCTWANTSAANVKFPTEMCVFFGFILHESDIYCTEGKWSAATATTSTTSTTSATGAAGAAGAAAAASGGSSAPAAKGCTSAEDRAIMNSATFSEASRDCSIPCAGDPDVATCTAPCFEKTVGLSPACALCNATNVACGSKHCFAACVLDSAGEACRSCVMTNCDAAFKQCTGT